MANLLGIGWDRGEGWGIGNVNLWLQTEYTIYASFFVLVWNVGTEKWPSPFIRIERCAIYPQMMISRTVIWIIACRRNSISFAMKLRNSNLSLIKDKNFKKFDTNANFLECLLQRSFKQQAIFVPKGKRTWANVIDSSSMQQNGHFL